MTESSGSQSFDVSCPPALTSLNPDEGDSRADAPPLLATDEEDRQAWEALSGKRAKPRNVVLPFSLMSSVAWRDGSVRAGLEEWSDEGLLDLDPDSLVPLWFPWQIEDVEFSPDDRRESFNAYLSVIYQTLRPVPQGTSSDDSSAQLTSRQRLVLSALHELRSMLRPSQGYCFD